MRLFREPDAGNPPVRIDEREEETERCQAGMRRRSESSANRHRETTVTAPLLDSTHLTCKTELSAPTLCRPDANPKAYHLVMHRIRNEGVVDSGGSVAADVLLRQEPDEDEEDEDEEDEDDRNDDDVDDEGTDDGYSE